LAHEKEISIASLKVVKRFLCMAEKKPAEAGRVVTADREFDQLIFAPPSSHESQACG